MKPSAVMLLLQSDIISSVLKPYTFDPVTTALTVDISSKYYCLIGPYLTGWTLCNRLYKCNSKLL